jgi:hypothetical protein
MGIPLGFSDLSLQRDVWVSPTQYLIEDRINTESDLREQSTSAWKKGWSEQAYDFPNEYVTIPLRVIGWNPISTFVDIQNERFDARYRR